MKKFSLFISGALFGSIIMDLARTSEYKVFFITFLAGIVIFALVEMVMGIIISFKVVKAKKVGKAQGEAYAKSIFKNLDQYISEKIVVDMAGTGKDKVKLNGDGKKFVKEMKQNELRDKFVYKSHLKSMTKRALHKYATVYGKFEKDANQFTRKEIIDWIVKHKMYKTRKKSDDPNL